MSSFSSPGVPGGFNTHGAVDLAALAAQRAARERAEAARSAARDQPPGAATDGAPASSSWVLEVDEATFQSAVIDRSMLVPVVIDFWADWAEPSQQLSPLLEQLVAEGATDYISLSRPLIREPHLVARWRAGDAAPARCISDNGCFDPPEGCVGLVCAVEERQARRARREEPRASE